jgi:hypothetical protein
VPNPALDGLNDRLSRRFVVSLVTVRFVESGVNAGVHRVRIRNLHERLPATLLVGQVNSIGQRGREQNVGIAGLPAVNVPRVVVEHAVLFVADR